MDPNAYMVNDNNNVLEGKVCGIHDVTILPRIWKAVEVPTQFREHFNMHHGQCDFVCIFGNMSSIDYGHIYHIISYIS